MKILFIVDYYYPYIGGAEVLHQKVAEYLAQKHEVTVLTQSSTRIGSEEILNNVRVVRIPTWHRITFSWQAKKIALNLAKNSDLIQVSTYSAGFLGDLIKRKLSKPVLLLVHGYLRGAWYQFGLPWWFAYLCRSYENMLFSKKFDRYVVPSQFTYSNLLKQGIAADQVHVIPHGIDTQIFQPSARNEDLRKKMGICSSEKVFLFSGRPSRMKGIECLLQAVQKGSFEIRVVLMLTKDSMVEYERVMSFIKQHNLSSQILVIDPVSHQDVPQYLSIADVIVIPSLTEEFCFLAAEVSAMKLPMIVTHAGALPEVVSGHAIFIAPGSTSEMMKAIQRAINNDFDYIPIKHFDWNVTLSKYEELYTKVLADFDAHI